jgi:predicted RNA-binding Zn ribbon-like protein
MPTQALSEEDLAFRFLAGRPSLALTATVGERWRRRFERLGTPGDLARWLVDAGVITSPPPVTPGELAAARKLREAVYRSALARSAGKALPSRDLTLINRHARDAALAPQLRRGELEWVAEDPVRAALSTLARDTLDLFAGPYAHRIRECASPECALLFVDTSRPGRRRWCSSETCGSRDRSAAYRSRRARATTT